MSKRVGTAIAFVVVRFDSVLDLERIGGTTLDWKEIYESRKCSASEAVDKIKSNDHVVFGHAVAEPGVLVDAMVANKEKYENVIISHLASLGKGEYSHPENRKYFNTRPWFISGPVRKAMDSGYADFTPVYFHEMPKYMRNGVFPIDVLMVMVSPPDEHGYCSTGVSSDYTMQAVKSAKLVLAEVNDQVPVVYGETFIHVGEIDTFTETSHPLPEIPLPVIGEVEKGLGKNCASLINDGDTIQVGIGAIPDAVLSQLKDKKDIGVHSEMISDGIVDLYEAGVINCSKKSIDKGKMVVTFLMGTRRLYDFAEKNPMVELRPVDYVNDPRVVAQCANLVCINACLQVDFLGQVASESLGTRQFSGVGGQVDFVRGAAMSHDGNARAIIATPSTAKLKNGTVVSKIVPELDPGTVVTTNRCDVDYIVTEYGIAHLKGKSNRERGQALISIAHPDFRDELQAAYDEKFRVKL